MVTHVGGDCWSTGSALSPGSNFVYPPGIQAGDVGIFVLTYSGSVTINDPVGWTFKEQRSGFNSDFQRRYERTMDGTEGGTPLAISWSASSKVSLGIDVWRYAQIGDYAWQDAASTSAQPVDVPPVVTPGSAKFTTFYTYRGSSPPTDVTIPDGTILVDKSFGTSSGSNTMAIAYSDTQEEDGSVGLGQWSDNSVGTGGRTVLTVSLLDTRVRLVKTQSISWNVAASANPGVRQVAVQDLSWNVSSKIAEAAWPAYIGHRGSDPGPEETLQAYSTLYGRSASYWHEGDVQILNDGVTAVASHDDTINRTYASGPVSTGNISAMSPAQWDATFLHVNSGYTGANQPAMRISAWVAAYGPGSGKAPIGIWENKVGTPNSVTIAAFQGLKGQVILNCDTLADAIACRAAGFEVCYQTNTPNFSDFTTNDFKYLSISTASMTSAIGAAAHEAGVKVLVYLVNNVTDRNTYAAMGVDGFFSNKPGTISTSSRMIKTQAISWNARVRLIKTQDLSWRVLNRFVDTQALSWNVRKRLAKTQALSWKVRKRLIKSQVMTWNVRTPIPTPHSGSIVIDGVTHPLIPYVVIGLQKVPIQAVYTIQDGQKLLIQ